MASKFLGKSRSFIKLIRPYTLLWFCISTCYGFASVILDEAPPFTFAYLVLTIVFANIAAIIVNDIGDIEVDKRSPELSKQTRPLATGAISLRTATVLAAIFYSLSLATSFLYGMSAAIFSIVIIVCSLSYSLPPLKMCARPYGSILYWVLLCPICYCLMVISLENINSGFALTYHDTLWRPMRGYVFIMGVILFFGIAEVIAKDLRDLTNDAEGGRNTYVNFVGVEPSVRILVFFAWCGFALWVAALYLSGMFPTSIAAWLCSIVGLLWCLRVHVWGLRLMKGFDQVLASRLHIQWTYAYASMQGLTFASYYFR